MTRTAPRSEFTARTKQKAFDRDGGRCVKCTTKLYHGRWQCDHIKPACEGGDNSLANAQCLCSGCHAPKSAAETRSTAKADRLHRKHIGAKPKKRKIPYRTADGTIHWNGK